MIELLYLIKILLDHNLEWCSGALRHQFSTCRIHWNGTDKSNLNVRKFTSRKKNIFKMSVENRSCRFHIESSPNAISITVSIQLLWRFWQRFFSRPKRLMQQLSCNRATVSRNAEDVILLHGRSRVADLSEANGNCYCYCSLLQLLQWSSKTASSANCK